MDEPLVGFVTDASKLLFKPMEVSGPYGGTLVYIGKKENNI